MTTPTLLAVVAHPDDETFGLGSVLLHAAAQGADTVVVCATRGEAGEVADGVALPVGGLAELREAELRVAAAALDVAAVELWELGDSGMDGDPPPGSLAEAASQRPDELVAAVTDAVRRHEPDVVLALDGNDGHRDHVAVREAVTAALAGGDVPLYLWALPRSQARAWVRAKTDDPASAAYTENLELGTPEEVVTTVLDTSAHYVARCAAMTLHRSQRSPWDGIPEELRRTCLTADHLIRVVPGWTGGERESAMVGLRPGEPAAPAGGGPSAPAAARLR